jgi:predicted KAP-like P-loop ATPase
MTVWTIFTITSAFAPHPADHPRHHLILQISLPMSTTTSIKSISSDRARVSDQEDLYGWSDTFVPMVARVTRQWPPRDGLTFGMYGPWGSGKSTVLNLLEGELRRDAATYPHTYIVRFNPWFYDSSQTLVTSFFASVGEALDADKGQVWSEAGTFLKKMGKFLAIASKGLTIATIGYDPKHLDAAAAVFSEAGEFAELADKGETPLRKIRDNLVTHLNKLGEAGGRIMVLIDDVDRLDGEELFTLLRLVRTVSDA